MIKILNELNDEQISAVTQTEGYIRVIAGAGCGKTKTLTNRYVYLVNELGISTYNIMCVTFTNKAANEMKKRIRQTIFDGDTALICTFHGFGVILLKEDIHVINYPKNFIILDVEDQVILLKNVYEKYSISLRNYRLKDMIEKIKFRKENLNYIEYLKDTSNDALNKRIIESKNIEEKIFYAYLYEQKKIYGIDFDDILNYTLYILKNFEEKRIKWQKRLMYIMVDEFQDVSSRQYEIVNILSKYYKNLFIVGDPDQTIYSWRGAKVEYIVNFDKAFSDVKTIILNKNYRSSVEILNASNSLIQNNKNRIKKELISMKKNNNMPVVYTHCKSTTEEAEKILEYVNNLANNNKYSDIAILYRAHFVSRSIEEIFIKNNIPYTLYSGVEFYKRKEIKDVLAYLRMLVYEDDLSFLRIINEPKRNIGNSRKDFLKRYSEIKKCTLYQALKDNIESPEFSNSKAKEFIELIEKYKIIYKEKNISDLTEEILIKSGYKEMLEVSGEEERVENLAELKQSMNDYVKDCDEEVSLEAYLDKMALYTNLEQVENKNTIKMMTIHSAKGLEFPYVFVCGLNEGIFPSRKIYSKDDMEEERRLAYVAFTRAERALFLTDAEGYTIENSFRYPSRFLLNVEKKYLNYTSELEEELIEGTKIEEENFEVFTGSKNFQYKVGDIIEHKTFGIGKIKEIQNATLNYLIEFQNAQVVRSIDYRLANKILRKIEPANEEISYSTKVCANENNEFAAKFRKKFSEIGNLKIFSLLSSATIKNEQEFVIITQNEYAAKMLENYKREIIELLEKEFNISKVITIKYSKI